MNLASGRLQKKPLDVYLTFLVSSLYVGTFLSGGFLRESSTLKLGLDSKRVSDPHTLYCDPDPVFFGCADPDPGLRRRKNLKKFFNSMLQFFLKC